MSEPGFPLGYSMERLVWGPHGRCVACRKNPATTPLGYCLVCHWEVMIEISSGWEMFEEWIDRGRGL